MPAKWIKPLRFILLIATPAISCAFLYLLCGVLRLSGGGAIVGYVYAIHVASVIALMFYPLYLFAITAYYLAKRHYTFRLTRIVIFLLPVFYSLVILTLCFLVEGSEDFSQFTSKILKEGLSIGYTNLLVYYSGNWLLMKFCAGEKP